MAKKIEDVSSFLQGNANPAPKKGKKIIPEITDAKELADNTFAAYQAAKDAEAVFRALEVSVLVITKQDYEARAKSGEFSKSFNVVGNKTPGVQVSYKDMFSDLPIECKADLQARLREKYDQYFEEKRVLTLADTSDSTIQLLVSKLGPEEFKKIFAIKVTVAAKADMDRYQFDLPEEIRPKQSKPSLKIRTGE
jgi:hypothetical protein